MNSKFLITLALLASVAAFGGCEKKTSTPAEKPQDEASTPADPAAPTPTNTRAATPTATPTNVTMGKATTPMKAIENMRDALLAGDRDNFVSCFQATDPQKKLLGSMADMASVTKEFKDKMVKAYGADAVKDSGKGSFGELESPDFLKDVEIKEDGDKATATKKGDPEPLNLVKKDGVWLIVADAMMPPGGSDADMAKGQKMIDTMVKVHKDAIANIGKEGYTADKINEEMGQAMMKAMMGG